MPGPSPLVRNAETIAVGTELLLGEIDDTNTAWLAAALAARGVDVYRSLRIGDNVTRLRAALDRALDRADLVVVCGGLGPTEDDVTREAIAALTGETPFVDPEQERVLRARFARLGRPMPERNLKQAWRLPSATVLPNPRGTAPGWLVPVSRNGRPRWIAALPGPPFEMTRMAEHALFPALPLPEARLWASTLKTAGLGESEIADLIGALAVGANPTVATYARNDGVHVRIAAKGDDAEAAEALGRPVADTLARRLGDATWGRDDDVLEEVALRGVLRRGARLAVVEDATGGALTGRLRAVPGAREAVLGAVVPWSTEARDVRGARPGVPPFAGDGVSVAHAAAGARAFFAADAAIAVGALRADGTERDATVEVVLDGWFGRAALAVPVSERTSSWLRERITVRALDLLRRRLRSDDE
ncbi:MAG: molybdopterin-binding protein [Trueperaceae bacterium]|nr:molybdopterin-binding protein [Trueperaceae bacterium]